jgi:hypothetical protein
MRSSPEVYRLLKANRRTASFASPHRGHPIRARSGDTTQRSTRERIAWVSHKRGKEVEPAVTEGPPGPGAETEGARPTAPGHDREPPERRPRRRSLLAVFVLVPVIAFALLLATGLGRDPRALPSEFVGKPAPAFALPRLGGGAGVDLASLRGQVVVNFWASWCLACRDEHPDLLAA